MESTLDENLKRAFERARDRLLANAPLLARASETKGAHAMGAGEMAALESVGLSVTPWKEGAAEDPLVRSMSDYMALLETSYTTSEAARFLKVGADRIRQRLREGSLYGVDYEGRKRLPRFQFEGGRVMPGLRDVLAALPQGLNPLDVAEWFSTPNSDLDRDDEMLSPREWLLSAREVAEVVALARGWR